MKILPEHIIEKTTSLAPDEVMRRIKQLTEPSWDKLRYLKSGKTFAGQVLQNSFKIIRIDPVRSKNRPLISGKVSATDSGSRITIKVGYNRNQSYFFLSVFFLFIFFVVSSFIQDKLVVLGVVVVIAVLVLAVLWLDFDREYHDIEAEFDKRL